MKKLIISIITIISIGFFSCEYFEKRTHESEVIARVHNVYLYVDDLDGIIEPGTLYQDSIVTVQRYVDTWVRQQVLLHEAKNSLGPDQMNFERKIQDYLNSLIIFTFEKDYINNNLDTLVSYEQISEYYEEYKDDFRLKENIVMASFIKVSLDTPNQNDIRKLIRSEEQDDRIMLEEYCIQNAAAYFLDNQSWLVFNDILRNIPLEVNNQEHFLRNNKLIEITDNFYRYFFYIYDYKLKEGVSPLAFEKKNIRNIIINKRKHKLINDYRNKLYRDAIKNNSFEVFI